MERTRTILNHHPSTSTGSQIGFRPADITDYYEAGEDPDPQRHTTVLLDEEVWQDMDRPEVITVTIEPGDLLNAGEDE